MASQGWRCYWIVRPALVLPARNPSGRRIEVYGVGIWLPALYLVGGIAALVAWKSISWPDNWLKYMSFGAIFLLVCVLNRALYFFDYLLSGARLDDWPFMQHEPGWALFTGEVITIVGTLLPTGMACGRGPQGYARRFVSQGGPTYRLMLFAYVLSLGVFGASARYSRNLRSKWTTLAHAACIGSRGGLSDFHDWLQADYSAFCCLGIGYAVCFGSAGCGNEGESYHRAIADGHRGMAGLAPADLRFGMVVAAIALIGLITAYVGHYRAEVWSKKADKPTENVASSFLEEMEKTGTLVMMTEGVTGFLVRNNASVHRGWAVSIADEDGYYPELVFAPLVYVFVPRMLWPESLRYARAGNTAEWFLGNAISLGAVVRQQQACTPRFIWAVGGLP